LERSTRFPKEGPVSLWKDCQKVAFKGNVVDLAVGVVIGGAFTGIVTAITSNLVLPIVSLVLPHGNWQSAGLVLRKDPLVTLGYGAVLGAVVNFFAIAGVLFLIVSKIVKAAEHRLSKPEEATTKECPMCLEVVPIKARRCKACTSELVQA
jgi:large conductance mechanosensitive channel